MVVTRRGVCQLSAICRILFIRHSVHVPGGSCPPLTTSAAGFKISSWDCSELLLLGSSSLIPYSSMTEFVSPGDPLPHIPDDLTLTQFIFDSTHECRPIRPQGAPWLVHDETGRKIGLEEVTMVFFPFYALGLYRTSVSVKRSNLEYPDLPTR